MIAAHNSYPSALLPPFVLFAEGSSMKKLPVGAIASAARSRYGIAPAKSPARDAASAIPAIVTADQVNRLPLDWILNPRKGLSLSERVLARLIQSEAHEAQASFRDDIRIAWLTVMHCAKGDAVECSAHVLATYQVLGCHPDVVYDRMMIRRAAAFGTEINRVKFPKKSARSIPAKKERQA